MSKPTGATMFSGGEGVGIAMRDAGIKHLWGIEFDPTIASVAQANKFNTIVGDVRSQNYSKLEQPYILHASPVCKNASISNVVGVESPDDIETANAVCVAIKALLPKVFTLENVWGYIKFRAFKNICATLYEQGYTFGYWHLNAADYGVAQQRKRLLLIARKDGMMPSKPRETHARYPGLSSTLSRWNGWYAAIEDLIPSLPDSVFGDWQLKHIKNKPSLHHKTFAVNTRESHFGEGLTAIESQLPFYTLMASSATSRHKAFVLKENQSNPIFQNQTDDDRWIENWLDTGRVVNMTTRALARIHSMPDHYELPTSDKLACTIIGNSVPPRLYSAVLDSLRYTSGKPLFA